MSIRKFRAGRVANATASTWVGERGTIFYDEATGQLKLSDGTTPGGSFIPLVIATSTTAGAIKAGPGVIISNDGTLVIDSSGLTFNFGNLIATGGNIQTRNLNEDLNIITNGSGNVNLVGNIHVHTTASWEGSYNESQPVFKVGADGQVTIYVPAADPNSGAVSIIGSTSRVEQTPVNTGVMLQVTGLNDSPSRVYNDAIGGYSGYISRRYNGTAASPTQVLNGDEISRFGINGYKGSWLSIGQARISFMSTDNQDDTHNGAKIDFYTTPAGSTTASIVKVFSLDGGFGANVTGKLAVTGNITAGNISSTTATFTGNITTTTNVIADTVRTSSTVINNGIVTTANITAGNVNAAVYGDLHGKLFRPVRNAGTIADGGTLTIDFSADSIVTCVWGNGLNLAYQNYTPGRVVKLMASKSSGTGTDNLNLDGITASQVSTGTTTIGVAADTTTFVELICTGTTIGSVYAKL